MGQALAVVVMNSIVTGLHVNGVVGALLALGCVFLVRVGRRADLVAVA